MGKAEANLEQAGRDQWDLLEQVAVEGAAVVQANSGVVDLVDLEAAVGQVGLAAAGEQIDLEAGEKVH